jgi:hexosaminidase
VVDALGSNRDPAANVFPRPRRVAWAGARGSPVEVAAQPDRSLPPEGYELTIGPDGTRIRHADDDGLRWARHTLADLAAAAPLPTGLIHDWPDFPHRGFLLDISRDRVPTMATLEWLVTRLAALRYNHLELYTEHTFAYRDHEAVWCDASPITPSELRRLDRMCRDHGIELCANQNTFGHMERWLCHADYKDRAECPDGVDGSRFPFRTTPSSLAPTPANAEFALGLMREMAANLRSKRVNVNADEPFDLGFGRSRALVERRGRAAVFVEHLRRLVDPLVAEGREVLFWGDGLVRHPELVPRLPPEGATAVVWNYEAPNPDGPAPDVVVGPEVAELVGLPERANLGFTSYVRAYAAAGYPFWVAPGTSSWLSLVGRWANARANLLDAATVGLAEGASGFLVTDWGDGGHPQPLPVGLLPAAYGAGVAWCAATNRDADVTPVVDRLLGARPGVAARLAELGDLYRRLGVSAINGSPLMLAMLRTRALPLRGRLAPAAAERTGEAIDRALDHFAAVPFTGDRAEALAAELVAACRLLRHGLWRLRREQGEGRVDDAALALDFTAAAALQREAWLATSRPGGLDDSLAKLGPP